MEEYLCPFCGQDLTGEMVVLNDWDLTLGRHLQEQCEESPR